MEIYEYCDITDPKILVEKVLKDQVFTGSITIPTRDTSSEDNEWINKTVPFLLTDNFSFSLGNKWDTLLPEAAGEALSSLYNMLTMTDMVKGAQMQVISKSMQSLAWKGCTKPSFSVNTIFVSTRRSYNPLKIIELLSSSCLPIGREQLSSTGAAALNEMTGQADKALRSGADWVDQKFGNSFGSDIYNLSSPIVKNLANSGLFAPLEYRVTPDLENDEVAVKQGTVALTIGRWFRAPDLVVSDINNIEFSKETIAPPLEWLNDVSSDNIEDKSVQSMKDRQGEWGYPLYAKCTINFVPIKPITFAEFQQYFNINNNSNSII